MDALLRNRTGIAPGALELSQLLNAGQHALLAGQRATQLLANANAALLLSKTKNISGVTSSSSPIPQPAPLQQASTSGPPSLTALPPSVIPGNNGANNSSPLSGSTPASGNGNGNNSSSGGNSANGTAANGDGSNSPSHGTSAGFCNICKKHVSNRTNHKYVHSQVKFRCKLCGYLYSRKDTLKDHIRGKHNTRFSTQDLNQLVEVVTPAQIGPNQKNSTRNANATKDIKDILSLPGNTMLPQFPLFMPSQAPEKLPCNINNNTTSGKKANKIKDKAGNPPPVSVNSALSPTESSGSNGVSSTTAPTTISSEENAASSGANVGKVDEDDDDDEPILVREDNSKQDQQQQQQSAAQATMAAE